MPRVPELKRVNTIGIRLLEGRLTGDLYEKIIETTLGIDIDDLYGIGERNEYKFLLKLNTEEKYQEICDNFTASNITVEAGVVIEVNDISSYRTRVVVRDIPFELSEDTLKLILGQYGKVERINRYYNYRLKNSKYEKIQTDRVIAWMELDSPIPSSFFIKQSQTYVYPIYDNQPKTCMKCGRYGHIVRYCHTRETDRSNLIDLDDFMFESSDEGETDNVSVKSDIMSRPSSDQGNKPFECATCDYKCNSQEVLTEHTKTHSVESDVIIHIDPSQRSDEYKCMICSYTCKYEGIFKDHMETHNGDKPYPCFQCSESFTSGDDLEQHLLTHSGENSYQCTQCGKCFSTKEDLGHHLLTHTGEKSYLCNQCEICFTTEHDLEQHLLIHSGEKPYPCSKCGESFTTNDDLEHHLLTHSKTKKQRKQFKCTECNFIGNSKGSLKRHKKDHSGDFEITLMCSKCDMEFGTEGELNMHEKCHSEEAAIDDSFAESVTEKVLSPSPKVVNQSTPKPRLQNIGRKSIPSSQPCANRVTADVSKNVPKRSLSVSPEDISNKKYARESFLKSTSLRKPSARVQGMKV